MAIKMKKPEQLKDTELLQQFKEVENGYRRQKTIKNIIDVFIKEAS